MFYSVFTLMEMLAMRFLCLSFPRLSIHLALRQHPELAARPLIMVAGSGDAALVAGMSTEAATRGVVTGMTPRQAKMRCPQARFLPDNAGPCLDELESIASILRRRATITVAIASREELLLDISAPSKGDDGDELRTAERIAGFARMWSGLPVRAGVASSRSAAREAARCARNAPVVMTPVLAWDEAGIGGVSDGPLAAEVFFPLGTSPLAARARLERASRQLQAILDASGLNYRGVELQLSRADGEPRVSRRMPEPSGDLNAALALVAAELSDDRLAGVTGIRLELAALCPDVRVEPAVALRAAS